MELRPSDPRVERLIGRRAALVLAGMAGLSILSAVTGLLLGGFATVGGMRPTALLDTLSGGLTPTAIGGALLTIAVLLTVAAPLAGLVVLGIAHRQRQPSLMWLALGTVVIAVLGILMAA